MVPIEDEIHLSRPVSHSTDVVKPRRLHILPMNLDRTKNNKTTYNNGNL